MKQRYNSYKPSGIEWIGEIPSHWDVVPIKQLCRPEKYSVKTGPFGSQLKGEDLKPEGEVIVYNQRNVIDNNFDDVQFFVSKQKAEELEGFVTRPNDVLVTSRGTIGRAAILSPENKMGILHPCLIALRINYSTANLKWIVRWINDSDAFQKEIDSKSNATTIDVIYTDTIKNIRLCLPPVNEQEAIAAWLDEKCGDIDAAIAKVDREIELIDELKQSEISRIVTRGLNPNVKLRPSGIEWIGDIPEHWEKCRFKNFIYLQTKPSTSEVKIGLENIESKSAKFISTDSEFEGDGVEFNIGDIVYGKLRPYLQKVWLAEFDGNAVGDFFIFKVFGNTHNAYVKYLLLSDGFTKEADGSTVGAKMPRVSSDFIFNMPFYLPPLAEQCEIADYLDKKCAEIDGLKSKLKKKRDTLVELRQAMISEVVTGKRKVI